MTFSVDYVLDSFTSEKMVRESDVSSAGEASDSDDDGLLSSLNQQQLHDGPSLSEEDPTEVSTSDNTGLLGKLSNIYKMLIDVPNNFDGYIYNKDTSSTGLEKPGRLQHFALLGIHKIKQYFNLATSALSKLQNKVFNKQQAAEDEVGKVPDNDTGDMEILNSEVL